MSAYSGRRRPGYRALLADIAAGSVDAVLAWHTDRLHRSPRELEEYVDLCERHKVTTQTVRAGELDLSTASGRAIARTLGAWARFEVEHKSDRTKAAQLQAAKAGRWLGGAPPLGWNLKQDGSATLDRPAARRIRKATADVLAGASLGSVVAAWNADGFRTSTGRAWNYTALRQVLSRARNAGLIELNGEIVGTSTWPAIVTEDQWRALRTLLADPGRRRSQSNRARWMLAGIAVCGADGCGTPLKSATASGRSGSRTVYRCPAGGGRGHVARAAEQVDQFVSSVIEARLARPDVVELLAGTDDAETTEALRAEAAALRVRRDDVIRQFADVDKATGSLVAILRSIEERLQQVEAEMVTMSRGAVLHGVVSAGDPVAAWRSATLDRRRSILRELFAVTILPVPKGISLRAFSPELVLVQQL